MKLTAQNVLHVAALARLEIDPASVDALAEQLAGILDYVDKLAEVDTEGVAPTAHAIELTNAFRDDVLHDHLSNQDALANAPSREDGCFVVPKVI